MTRTHATPKTRRILTALVGFAVLSLAACGNDSTDESMSDAAPATTAMPATLEPQNVATGIGEGAAPADVTKQADGSPGPSTVLPIDRKMIFTGGIEVVVADVGDASLRVKVLAEGAGGFVAQEQTSLGENAVGTLVVKLPPQNLTTFTESVNGLGEVRARNQQSQDVTAQFVDLEARISSARASVTRVRELVARAETVTELATVEAELTRRETELEQLLGQQRVLNSQIDFATVTVSLFPDVTSAVVAASEELPGQRTVLERSVGALRDALYLAWLVVIALAPWMILAALFVVPGVLVLRRRRRRLAALRNPIDRSTLPETIDQPARNLPEPVVQEPGSRV